MAREKKKVVVAPKGQAEAIEHFKEYAKANSSIKKIEANMELQFQKIRDKYNSEIANLTGAKEDSFDHLQAYAEANKEKLFPKKKSFDMQFGLIGYRTGTPKLAKQRGTTWEAILKLMKTNELEEFVETKESIDKKSIIAMRGDVELKGKLIKIGVEVTQDESFFVEAKEEQLA